MLTCNGLDVATELRHILAFTARFKNNYSEVTNWAKYWRMVRIYPLPKALDHAVETSGEGRRTLPASFFGQDLSNNPLLPRRKILVANRPLSVRQLVDDADNEVL